MDIALHSHLNLPQLFSRGHTRLVPWASRSLNVLLGLEPVCLDQYLHLIHRSQSEIRCQFLKMI